MAAYAALCPVEMSFDPELYREKLAYNLRRKKATHDLEFNQKMLIIQKKQLIQMESERDILIAAVESKKRAIVDRERGILCCQRRVNALPALPEED